MKTQLTRTLLLLIALSIFFSANAQKVKSTKKSKAKEEEIEMPPPPMEELKEVRIDTSGVKQSISSPQKGFKKEDFFFNMPDTSAAPNDDLTKELKKLLDITGALDVGVQFAKMMNSDNEQERNGLPKEFYKKMYEEMSTGDTRKIFENEIIKIYRKYYTLEDVKGILAFYNSEIGKKTLTMIPSILEESKRVGTEFGRVIGMKVYNDLLKEGKIN